MSKLPPAPSPLTATDSQDDANLVLDTINSQDADIGEPTLNAIENPLEDADARVPEVASIDPKQPSNESDITDSDCSPLAKDVPPDPVTNGSDEDYRELCLAAFTKAEQHRQANTTVTTEADAIWTALGELDRAVRVHEGLPAYPLNAMTGNEIEEIDMGLENGTGLAGMAQGDLRRHF